MTRLKHPEAFSSGGHHCLSLDGMEWTADFKPSFHEFLGMLSDGSFIALIESRYLVRFRADITSPFFYGRSDIVLLPFCAENPEFSSENPKPPNMAPLNAIVNRAAKEQIAAGKSRPSGQ
ncbi:hypothetical protein [Telmatospirillum sp.]|uniref:hypothetical protein n=1 Tax=Telmatospirillum sp. TaxID=2079197 RepID=UPI00283E0C18|nr:hypothetical protein [Telmatospirillum sp.]MDR3439706.1 hypothetical protein [Telmatospirillum sp.]